MSGNCFLLLAGHSAELRDEGLNSFLHRPLSVSPAQAAWIPSQHVGEQNVGEQNEHPGELGTIALPLKTLASCSVTFATFH